jgi:hypothetical protein
MDVFIWIAILAIFFDQLAVVAVIIQRFRLKTAKLSAIKTTKADDDTSRTVKSGGKYFFEKNEKTGPQFGFYAEIEQFDIRMFSADAISCGLDELSDLMDMIDPMKGSFFMVITDDRQQRVLQFQYDVPGKIEVSVSGNPPDRSYLGVLPFAGDMKHFMSDCFAGVDVADKYSLTQGSL